MTPATKPDSREALLTAAEKLFAARSYSDVGVRELAEEAGANLGLIQYHFGSKGGLFVETVRRMMGSCAGSAAAVALTTPPRSRPEAAADVALFVRLFLDCLLRPRSPEGCRLAMREVLGNAGCPPEVRAALVALVADELTGPLLERLCAHLIVVAPGTPPAELEAAADAILGQCSHYLANRPFLERLRARRLDDRRVIDNVAAGAARFALRGLRCDESMIDQAVAAALGADLDERLARRGAAAPLASAPASPSAPSSAPAAASGGGAL